MRQTGHALEHPDVDIPALEAEVRGSEEGSYLRLIDLCITQL